jgi:xanthine dehydrogenase accessory factor
MTTTYQRAAELAAAGRAFALATVVRTHGSTPQTVGAKLIVTENENERPFGTLGGGCVEADAILAARQVLIDGRRVVREYRLTEELAWGTGLVCGGTMWVLAERGEAAVECCGENILGDLAAASAGGAAMTLVTRLARKGRGFAFDGRVAVRPDGRVIGTFGTPDIDQLAVAAAVAQLSRGTAKLVAQDAGHDFLIEPITARPRLIVAGGGHVSRAIARQARLLEFEVIVLEDRPAFAEPERFDGAAVMTGDVAENIGTLEYGPQTFLVIATRGHKMDADCVMAAINTQARYIGLLGSRRKTILISDMLREAGVAEDRIAAIRAPVGLDLGGRTPAEIALSVVAEITLGRYQGTGTALSKL